jgi:hypothetical protein
MFKTVLGLSVLGFTASLVAASPALAQGRNCAPREVVVERLASKYGESRQAIGIGQQGITVTMPTGMTCLMASGQSFEALAEAVPTVENDA